MNTMIDMKQRTAAWALTLLAGAMGAGATGAAWAQMAPNPAKGPAVAATTAAVKATPAANLRVTYYTKALSQDGVLRESTHTNRVYRRPAMVWTERELPQALMHSTRHGHSHGHVPHAGHAHDEANGAPLRVSRADDGTEKVEVILDKLKRVIEVDRAHHGNVGYGGHWDAQYWLVPPASLANMQAVGTVQGGVQRYRQVANEQTTVVDWDVKGQYPRRIERSDAHGTSLTRVTAQHVAAPKVLPWVASASYARGDYSDLLD